MPIFITVLIILIVIYLVFIAGPAVTGLFSVFKKPFTREPETMRFKGNYREPFEERVCSDCAFLRKQDKKRIWITSDKDGVRLCADYFDRGYDRTAVLIHGYSTGPYLNLSVHARWLLEQGFNVMFIFQRAHGDSEGKRSTLGLLEQYDLLCWIEYVSHLKKVKSILIYGASMGAVTAAFASNKIRSKKVKAIIFDSGYTSPYDQMAYEDKKRHLPYFLLMPVCSLCAKLFLGLDIKSSPESSLKNNRIPAFFLHGTADTTVPIIMGKKNYEACASEKEKLYIEGADHLMSFMKEEERVKEHLSSFIKKYIS